jgi:hypothetical protein
MSKQTAVEWLLNNLLINGLLRLSKDEHSLYKELKDQAKAMEKENSLDAFFAGFNYEGGHPIDQHEEFYTKTYTDK